MVERDKAKKIATKKADKTIRKNLSSKTLGISNKSSGQESQEGFFQSFDGTKLWFSDTGGPGVPLFFVYGLGCSIQHWKYPRQHFGPQGLVPRRQVYLDLRGHGRSPAPAPGQVFTLKHTIQDILVLCDYLNISQAVFLGQSMGGSIIATLAFEHPNLVQKMVLLGSPSRSPTYCFPAPTILAPIWRGLLRANQKSPRAISLFHRVAMGLSRREPFKFTLREVIRKGGFNSALALTSDIEEYISKITSVDGNTFFQMAAELEEFDVKNFQDGLKMPTLIIAGAQDRVIPLSDQLRYKSFLPHAQIEIIPHGSHCPHFDDPKLVNRMLESFI